MELIFSRKVYRDIIAEAFSYCRTEKGMILHAYVIMTNHIHVIMRSYNGDLSGLIRDFKKFTSKQIIREVQSNKVESRRDWLEMIFRYHAKFNKRAGEYQFWTHENHAVELTTNYIFDIKLDYIHNNPVRAGWVEQPEDYLYSSARNYAGLSSIIEIDMI